MYATSDLSAIADSVKIDEANKRVGCLGNSMSLRQGTRVRGDLNPLSIPSLRYVTWARQRHPNIHEPEDMTQVP